MYVDMIMLMQIKFWLSYSILINETPSIRAWYINVLVSY